MSQVAQTPMAFPAGTHVEHVATGRRGYVHREIRRGAAGRGSVDWGPGEPPRVGHRIAYRSVGDPPNVWDASADDIRTVAEPPAVEPLCDLLRECMGGRA